MALTKRFLFFAAIDGQTNGELLRRSEGSERYTRPTAIAETDEMFKDFGARMDIDNIFTWGPIPDNDKADDDHRRSQNLYPKRIPGGGPGNPNLEDQTEVDWEAIRNALLPEWQVT